MSSFDEKILNAVSDIVAATGTTNPFRGKYVSIIGDCLSSYEGFIPEGCTPSDHEAFETVDKLWWYQVLMKLGANLCVNYSSADMQITGTDTKSASYSHYGTKLTQQAGDKFIKADGKTYTLGNGTRDPDVILIMLGLNDFLNNATFSDFTHSDISLQEVKNEEITDDSIFNDVKTAYERILYDVVMTYPYATVYCLTAPPARAISNGFPFPNSAGWSMPFLDELIRICCLKYSVKYISLCQLCARANASYVGSDKFLINDRKHLTELGHKLVAKECCRVMMNDYVSWGTLDDI